MAGAFTQLIEGMRGRCRLGAHGSIGASQGLTRRGLSDERIYRHDRRSFSYAQTCRLTRRRTPAISPPTVIQQPGRTRGPVWVVPRRIWKRGGIGDWHRRIRRRHGNSQCPGHRRRLRALSRLHARESGSGQTCWTLEPRSLAQPLEWPGIDAAMRSYGRYIYAATAVRGDSVANSGLLPICSTCSSSSIGAAFKAPPRAPGGNRLQALHGRIFPSVDVGEVEALLRERRFVILEGPPGTGKTRLAMKVGKAISSRDDAVPSSADVRGLRGRLYPQVADRALPLRCVPEISSLANASASRASTYSSSTRSTGLTLEACSARR